MRYKLEDYLASVDCPDENNPRFRLPDCVLPKERCGGMGRGRKHRIVPDRAGYQERIKSARAARGKSSRGGTG